MAPSPAAPGLATVPATASETVSIPVGERFSPAERPKPAVRGVVEVELAGREPAVSR